MNNLKTISLGEFRAHPPIPRHYVEIEFDGDPIRLHSQELYQSADGHLPVDETIFAVDDNVHCY